MPEMYAATPAWCLLAAGEPGWAEVVLHPLRTDDESHRPRDAEWLECHWSMAEMALLMGDQRATEILLRELRPYDPWGRSTALAERSSGRSPDH